ncbi:VWA domain-containing protein [Streptomyces armeniacus]|uniref:VWA domain-containing protein n=1 Tax=Streptomyces armeniacus TaxID=83291 RepID=UPI001AD823BC|nr:VWA domain-containing protein [Streptomyces armeniacus]
MPAVSHVRAEPADAVTVLVGFARALRAAGVDAGPDRVQTFLDALDVLDPARRQDLYWAGRLTLCGDADDLERYDRVFDAYFAPGPRPRHRTPRPAPAPRTLRIAAGPEPAAPPGTEDAETGPPQAALASSTEVLRHRDIAELTAAERAALHRLLNAFALPGEQRRTPRRLPARRGAVDPRRTVRELLRGGGELVRLRRRAPAHKPRRVVLLLDVSGSMTPYADALLRFAHAASHGRGGFGPVYAWSVVVATAVHRICFVQGHGNHPALHPDVDKEVQMGIRNRIIPTPSRTSGQHHTCAVPWCPICTSRELRARG